MYTVLRYSRLQYPDAPCMEYVPTNLPLKHGPNVGKYSMHGVSGLVPTYYILSNLRLAAPIPLGAPWLGGTSSAGEGISSTPCSASGSIQRSKPEAIEVTSSNSTG